MRAAPRLDIVTRPVSDFPVAVVVATDRALYSAITRRQSLLIGSLAALAVVAIGYTFGALVRVLRRREEYFIENQRLRISAEAASKAKSQFLATVSHEIRTPMNGIIGAAELLVARDMPDEPRRLAAMLLRSGRNLLGTLNDVLDFSRIEAGELYITAQPFDLPVVVRDVAELFHAFATTKGLTLETEVAPDVPPCLVGDAARIRQVLSNLVGNAGKFTDTGFVALRASVDRSADHVATLVFEVEDSGVGIPAEARERIFDAFAQADSSVVRRFDGSGLGLAISRRLALLMGGSLEFANRHQGGSCFRFAIPLIEAPAIEVAEPTARPAAAPCEAQTQALPALHVLVTEDNAVNAMVVEAQLQSLGCTCDVAVDGEAGYDATRTWREREARDLATHLPIIALTANALSSNVEQAREAGMDDFLTKPCALDDLRSALKRAIDRVSPAPAFPRPALRWTRAEPAKRPSGNLTARPAAAALAVAGSRSVREESSPVLQEASEPSDGHPPQRTETGTPHRQQGAKPCPHPTTSPGGIASSTQPRSRSRNGDSVQQACATSRRTPIVRSRCSPTTSAASARCSRPSSNIRSISARSG